MKFFPSFSFLSSFSSFFALIFFYVLLYSPSYDGSGRNNVRLDLYLDKETCDLTCVWTKWLVTWLDVWPNDLWLDLDKKWLAAISDLSFHKTKRDVFALYYLWQSTNQSINQLAFGKCRGDFLLPFWHHRGTIFINQRRLSWSLSPGSPLGLVSIWARIHVHLHVVNIVVLGQYLLS